MAGPPASHRAAQDADSIWRQQARRLEALRLGLASLSLDAAGPAEPGPQQPARPAAAAPEAPAAPAVAEQAAGTHEDNGWLQRSSRLQAIQRAVGALGGQGAGRSGPEAVEQKSVRAVGGADDASHINSASTAEGTGRSSIAESPERAHDVGDADPAAARLSRTCSDLSPPRPPRPPGRPAVARNRGRDPTAQAEGQRRSPGGRGAHLAPVVHRSTPPEVPRAPAATAQARTPCRQRVAPGGAGASAAGRAARAEDGEHCGVEVEGSPLGASVFSVPDSVAASVSMDWSLPAPEDDVELLAGPSLSSQALDERPPPGPSEAGAVAALQEAGVEGIDLDELVVAEASTASLPDVRSMDFSDWCASSARLPPRPASAGGSSPSRPGSACARQGRSSAYSSRVPSAQERRPAGAAAPAFGAEGGTPPGPVFSPPPQTPAPHAGTARRPGPPGGAGGGARASRAGVLRSEAPARGSPGAEDHAGSGGDPAAPVQQQSPRAAWGADEPQLSEAPQGPQAQESEGAAAPGAESGEEPPAVAEAAGTLQDQHDQAELRVFLRHAGLEDLYATLRAACGGRLSSLLAMPDSEVAQLRLHLTRRQRLLRALSAERDRRGGEWCAEAGGAAARAGQAVGQARSPPAGAPAAAAGRRPFSAQPRRPPDAAAAAAGGAQAPPATDRPAPLAPTSARPTSARAAAAGAQVTGFALTPSDRRARIQQLLRRLELSSPNPVDVQRVEARQQAALQRHNRQHGGSSTSQEPLRQSRSLMDLVSAAGNARAEMASRPRRISPAQLRRLVASLPATVVTGTPPSEACTICLQAPQQDEVLVTLPCKHWYHSDCIREWLGVSRLCPLCKGSVVPQDTD